MILKSALKTGTYAFESKEEFKLQNEYIKVKAVYK